MKLLTDPALFNYIILTLYCLAALRWGFNGSWAQVLYWVGAILLQCAVTWGMRH